MAQTIVFTVAGKRYPMPDKLTFGDAHLLRKMDVNLAELSIALADGDFATLSDPVFMGGLLLIAMKHAGVRVHPGTLDAMAINDVDVDLEGEPDAADAPDPLGAEAETPPTKKKKPKAAHTGAATPADSGDPA